MQCHEGGLWRKAPNQYLCKVGKMWGVYLRLFNDSPHKLPADVDLFRLAANPHNLVWQAHLFAQQLLKRLVDHR